ncbi:hypothetical protein [Butyrivibrio sp. VCD2006]|uniref:hypothetical protein n=1 Tax=Butyrivibrio sp. VCD2006 TaxID=1280664 RepID=UPI00042042C5|nr:hypothetical protein [Butyrivibrio sp. VCD2006]
MKKVNNSFLIIAITALLILPTGCGSKKIESWAYTHEPDKETIALYDNGKAVFKGENYTYTKDDSWITLTDKSKNELKLRYEMNGEGMTLYEKSTYKLDKSAENAETENNGDGESIIGTWVQDNGWSYVFTPEGEFSEEGIFFGHYSVDDEKSCIRLMYNDPIEDAFLYYTLNGDELTVDYPWPMTKTEQN